MGANYLRFVIVSMVSTFGTNSENKDYSSVFGVLLDDNLQPKKMEKNKLKEIHPE